MNVNKILLRDLCKINDIFYIFNDNEKIWKETENVFNWRTTIKDLNENKIKFNIKNKLITFNNSIRCIDIKSGYIREIQREDYLLSKSSCFKIINEDINKLEKELLKIMVKKDFEKLIVDFTDILFHNKKKILNFGKDSVYICEFLKETFDEYCSHLSIQGTPDGKRIIKPSYIPEFPSIISVIKTNDSKDVMETLNYFSTNENSLMVYNEKLDKIKIIENSIISVYKGKKTIKKNLDLMKDLGSLFLKYLILNKFS